MKQQRQVYDLFESEVVLIGAATESGLYEMVTGLLHFIDSAQQLRLSDLAFTCCTAARKAPVVLGIVAATTEDLRAKLRIAQRKLGDGAARIKDKSGIYYSREHYQTDTQLAFVYPGELSPYPDMLRDLCLAFGDCRAAFDDAAVVTAAAQPGKPIEDHFFSPVPRAHRTTQQIGADASFTAQALTAAYSANSALTRIFTRLGIYPSAVVGHSGGEIAALAYAGVFGRLAQERYIKFLTEGHQLVLKLSARVELPEGFMFATSGIKRVAIDDLLEAYPGRLELTMQNSPDAFILCAANRQIADAIARMARSKEGRLTPLPFRRAFHTPWFARGTPTLTQFYNTWVCHEPILPLYSCITADLIPTRLSEIVKICAIQWASPVRFTETIEKMYDNGVRVFVELGARGQLTEWIDSILADKPHLAVATNRIHRSGMVQLNHALAQLAAHGIAMDAAALHYRRPSRLLDLAKPYVPKNLNEKPIRLSARPPEMRLLVVGDIALRANEAATAESTTAPARSKTGISNGATTLSGTDFPLLANAEIMDEQQGVSIQLRKRFILEDYPFVQDFALGAARLPATRTKLHGFSLMSLTTLLEVMAEVARRLAPRKRVDQVDNLRAQGWIGFERGDARLIAEATQVEWPDKRITAIKVELREDDQRQQHTWPLAAATFLLTSSPVDEIQAEIDQLSDARAVGWKGTEIYPDRLPQGPLLQSVTQVNLWHEKGLDYELRVPERASAVRHTRTPLFSCWPLLLDGLVAGMALWRAQEKFNGAIGVPFRARSIRFSASAFPDNMQLKVALRIRNQTIRSHVADIMAFDASGRLLIEIKGWEEMDTYVAQIFHRFTLRPEENFATSKLSSLLLGDFSSTVVGSIVSDIPEGLLEANQGLWLKTLAFTVLSASEREDWVNMKGTTARRIEWLLGRVAAKDAVRRYLLQHHQQTCAAAEIPIWADDSGKPHAHGAWRDDIPDNLDLSIAHTPGLVLAAVAANSRIGIDIERCGRELSEDFSRGVFTPAEHELATHSGEGPTALLRFWCAKEALSKALGSGIRYSPSELRVQQIDLSTGVVTMEVSGQWLDAFSQMRKQPVHVKTSLYDNHVMAVCVLPLGLVGNA